LGESLLAQSREREPLALVLLSELLDLLEPPLYLGSDIGLGPLLWHVDPFVVGAPFCALAHVVKTS